MMVGEIRDLETAEVAIRAALTGHLVFSTVHTNDAPSTITRMIDQGVEPYLVASSLVLIIAQRLVRTVCPHCTVVEPINDEWAAKLKKVGLDPSELEGQIAYGAGCDECFQSGYSGRTAIYEFLPVTEELRTQVMEGGSATDIKGPGASDPAQDGRQKIRSLTTRTRSSASPSSTSDPRDAHLRVQAFAAGGTDDRDRRRRPEPRTGQAS